jgi:hypothetical protein
MIMVFIEFFVFYSSLLIYSFIEMNDESDTATSDKKKPTGRKGKATGASKKQSENDDPAKDDLHLSEGEDSADDKHHDGTAKKGSNKRSASSPDKKNGKKRSAEDEPFEDRTNDDESAEYNSEEGQFIIYFFNHSINPIFLDGSLAKQSKKGRSGDKAPSSASKGNTRAAKKTKTT